MSKNFTPGTELLAKVRAGFIAQGTSFSGYCEDNNINRPNARQALLGAWDGPAGRALRAQLVKAANVEQMARAS